VGGWKTVESAHSADIDIQQAVVVDIYDRDTCGPAAVLGNGRGGGDVPEMKAAGIKIKFVAALVGSKEQVNAAISIEVPGSDAGAVVIIHIIEDIEFWGRMKGIIEIQPCLFWVQHFKNRIFGVSGGGMPAALEDDEASYGKQEDRILFVLGHAFRNYRAGQASSGPKEGINIH